MTQHYERLLGVNIDHIATLRQARGRRYPEPLQAPLLAEQPGADAITLHLREDRRHIQDRDVRLLAGGLQTRMNQEMAATAEMLAVARDVRPDECCLVREGREELTTEGGLDAAGAVPALTDYCAALAEAGVRASLFIDADPLLYIADAAELPLFIETMTVRAAAPSEQMHHLTLCHIPNAIAQLLNTTTQVDIFEIHEEAFIQSAQPREQGFANHETGAIRPIDILRLPEVRWRHSPDQSFHDCGQRLCIAHMIAK